MRSSLLLVLFICLVLPASPLRSDAMGFPSFGGYVIDREGQISSDTDNFLHYLLQLHEEETSYRITVITHFSTGDLSIEAFSDRLVQHWGLGQAGKPDGAVLVFIPRKKSVGIGVSGGLKDVLTDAHVKTIIDEYILPSVRQNDAQRGLSKGAREITHVLSGKPIGFDFRTESEQQEESFLWGLGLTVFGIIALMIVSLFASGWTDYDKLARNYTTEGQRIASWGGGGADFNPVIQSIAPPQEFDAGDERSGSKNDKRDRDR